MLPKISDIFAGNIDPAAIEAGIISACQTALGRTLAPADPLRAILSTLAAVITQLCFLLRLAMRANLLATAAGNDLDNLGALFGVSRLPASPAATVLEFVLSTAQPGDVVIPAGTRVSDGNSAVFATTIAATVPAGDTTKTVAATALVAGVGGNGYLSGQINQPVDILPWIASVSNTSTSAGGAETEADDALRARIQLAPTAFSVAGPTGAYEYWTKSYSPAVIDVSVTSPDAGEVLVTPLLTDGALPDSGTCAAILAILSAATRRPLTDSVSVAAPTVTTYDITLTYYVNQADAARETAIDAAVTQAVTDYAAWQRAKLGRDINPSELIRRVMDAGAQRVTLTYPAYAAVDNLHVAHANTPSITDGGLEAE